ncbi:MAG: hypothetical protein HYX89_02060 [Chloroflexi bacterium]|nr:hypothetical protein [Chloroflexota bacterium]
MRDALDAVSTEHLESLFAELESYGVNVQNNSEAAQVMDAWLAATEELRAAESPAAARAAYQRILAEERKLTALRDALRLQHQ